MKWSRSRRLPMRPLMPPGTVSRFACTEFSFGSCSFVSGSAETTMAVGFVGWLATFSVIDWMPKSFGLVKGTVFASNFAEPTGSISSDWPGLTPSGNT